MKNSKVKPSIVVGTFLALVLVAVAARYEDFVVTKLTVLGTSAFTGAITATGGVTGNVTGNVVGTDVSVADDFIVTPQSQNVTNTQAVTLESGSLLVGVGQAAASTNTITIAAPGAGFVGKVVVIGIGATSSNIVAIADQAPCDLAGAAALGVGDTLMLWATSATTWLEVSRSNN